MNKHTITLTDGVTQFDLYDLEQNGPNNTSTPRFIQSVSLTGGAGTNSFTLNGDVSFRFVPGFTFSVIDSGSYNGTYTVSPLGTTVVSVGSVETTTIPVNETLPAIALPIGKIQYSIPAAEEATSMLLSGKGSIEGGLTLTTAIVHQLENFANVVANPPANPILGQQFFATDEDQMYNFTSTGWEAIGSGAGGADDLVFDDPQNPTPGSSVILSADDNKSGLSVRLDNDILPVGNHLTTFRVTAANDAIDYMTVGGNPTQGGRCSIKGMLNIDPTSGTAGITVHAPATQTPIVQFLTGGNLLGDMQVSPVEPTTPLEINRQSTNDIRLAQGGGNVGIGALPTTSFQIKNSIYFDEGGGDVSVGPDIRLSTDGAIASNGSMYTIFDTDNNNSGSYEIKAGGLTSSATTLMLLDRDKTVIGSDVLHVDTINNRVGINKVPTVGVDVDADNLYFNATAVNGNVVFTLPNLFYITANQTSINGDASVSDLLSVGGGVSNNTLVLTTLGKSEFSNDITLTTGQVLAPNGVIGTPSLSFSSQPTTGISAPFGNGTLAITAGGTTALYIGTTGIMNTPIAGYESQVVNDGHIPNKKYVDDRTSTFTYTFINASTGTPTITQPGVTFLPRLATGETFTQVFVDGVYIHEEPTVGASGGYHVQSGNIVFVDTVTAGARIVVFELK